MLNAVGIWLRSEDLPKLMSDSLPDALQNSDDTHGFPYVHVT